MQVPREVELKSDVEAVFARLFELYAVSNDAQLAKTMGQPKTTVASWRQRGIVPYAICVDVAVQKSASLDWLLFGIGHKDMAEAIRDNKAGYAAKPEAMDFDLMRAVIEAACAVFDERQLHLPPAKFAELVMLAYELEVAVEARDPKARVVQLIRLAA